MTFFKNQAKIQNRMLDPINEIKSRIDIVDLISGYTKLTKAGANYKALCPFHSEKTPSFIVSPSKQIWHCFGSCSEGGDIFKFIMKIEGFEFPDALRFLADRAGVALTKQDPKLKTERARLYEFHERAADYFERCLGAAEKPLKYLKQRGLTKKIVKEFRLGYAPANTKALGQFKNRIIFPICDLNGQVVGFTARVLDKSLPKYINSPDSLVYKKSLILFGLDKAKQAIREKNLCVLVEGNMDVIMSHQAGVKNAVASSGSALSANQLKIIRRYTNNLVLAFDSDSAGGKATKRTIDLALEQEMKVKVIALKDKDPADLIKRNKQEWQKAIKKAKLIMRYYFNDAFKEFDAKKLEGKKEIAGALLPLIKKIPNEIEQSYWIQKLSLKLNIDEKILLEQSFKIKFQNLVKQPETKILQKSRLEKLQDRLASLKKNELLVDDPKKEIKICQKEIKIILLKDKLKQLSEKIKQAEQNKKKSLLKKLIKQFNTTSQKLK
ncbi:MAG: CHC2 zinc finger domain-containing protein [bacterium]